MTESDCSTGSLSGWWTAGYLRCGEGGDPGDPAFQAQARPVAP